MLDYEKLFPKTVLNTNGLRSNFNGERIYNMIRAETSLTEGQAKSLTKRVLVKIVGLEMSEIEANTIRSLVQQTLFEDRDYTNAAKVARLGMPIKDVEKLLNDGCNENSNQDHNPESTHSWIADQIMEQYVLQNILSPAEREAHETGRLAVHMMRYWDRPFCQEWDLRIILLNGIPPGASEGAAKSKPARSALTAATHAAKWLAIIQGEFSGGQGYDNFTTFMAPYLVGLPFTSEDPNVPSITQVAQCFIFESNQVFAARGGQAPFTSISCTPFIPKPLLNVPAVAPGGIFKGTYKDYAQECRLFFKALVDVYAAGDANGKMFAFPKHEVKLTPDGIRDYEKDYKYCVEQETVKMGSTYFLNGCASWMPEEVHSQCCRIIFTKEGMLKYCQDPTIFDWETNFNNLGSLQSVSINLPHLALEAISTKEYVQETDPDREFPLWDAVLHELGKVFKIVEGILLKKLAFIQNMLEHKRLPYCSVELPAYGQIRAQPMLDMRKQSLSVGFVGLHELLQLVQREEGRPAMGLLNPPDFELGKQLLQELQDLCLAASARNHMKFSLWEQPAESTAGFFFAKDLHYPEAWERLDSILPCGRSFELFKNALGHDRVKTNLDKCEYTNSGHLPYHMSREIPLWDRIVKQAEYQEIIQGGVITHLFLGDRDIDPDALWQMTKNIALKSNTAYFSYTFDFTYCKVCMKFMKGMSEKCPRCGASGEAIEWYSKITGYYSRVKRWNAAKFEEWKERDRQQI